MAKDKISGKKFDKKMKKIPFEMGPVPERRPRGPNTPDEVSFKHSVPELFNHGKSS
jgi:hypothetical protein